MSKADWGYLFLAGLCVFWWFAARLDQLGRQLEYSTYRIRREMAELLGEEERADELREEDDQDEQERKKTRRQETIGLVPGCLPGGGTPALYPRCGTPPASISVAAVTHKPGVHALAAQAR